MPLITDIKLDMWDWSNFGDITLWIYLKTANRPAVLVWLALSQYVLGYFPLCLYIYSIFCIQNDILYTICLVSCVHHMYSQHNAVKSYCYTVKYYWILHAMTKVNHWADFNSTNKCPISRPHGQVKGYLLWIFKKNVTMRLICEVAATFVIMLWYHFYFLLCVT